MVHSRNLIFIPESYMKLASYMSSTESYGKRKTGTL